MAERDSNRYGYPHTPLAGERLRPLATSPNNYFKMPILHINVKILKYLMDRK